jgi:putative ABC transport system permease protein
MRLTIRIAAQNLARRPLRASLLGASVALAAGIAFAAFVVGWSLRDALTDNFARGGADLAVVPRPTLVNIASSLLTVEPTDDTMSAAVVARIAAVDGVARAAPQRIVRVTVDGRSANLIAFDPAADFTVLPWLRGHGKDSVAIDAVIAGGRVPGEAGATLQVCGQSLRVHDRLRTTGVGPFYDSYFITFAGLDFLAALCARDPRGKQAHDAFGVCMPDYRGNETSAVLVQLAPGARIASVTFALSQLPGVKVVEGNALNTSSRETVRMLFTAIAATACVVAIVLVVMVAVLFSAIVHERQREIGLLRALGAARAQVTRIVLTEVALVTGIGGAIGVGIGCGLLTAYARSLGVGLEALGSPPAWPATGAIVAAALVTVLVSALLGVAGALVPVLRVQRCEPHALVRGEAA